VSLRTKHLILAIALPVLMMAQVFGLQRSYACFCSGELIETDANHCHDSQPHDSTGHHAPHHDDENSSDQHHHLPLVEELKAHGKNFETAPLLAPLLMVLFELPDFITELEVRHQTFITIPLSHEDIGDSPPASLLVADCMVFLI
jgi:hypothetical protein